MISLIPDPNFYCLARLKPLLIGAEGELLERKSTTYCLGLTKK
jgi:hypothetical protein